MVREAFSETGQLKRLDSIDCLRGVVMILMALDHVREFFGPAGVNPTDPATTTVALFMTRWVTHFCAPSFVLLTGAGAGLAGRRRSRSELSRFLLLRGLWLVAIELAVVRWIMQFNLDYRVTLVTVFWTIGWSLVILAVLVYLPASFVTAIGVAMIVTRPIVANIRPARFGPLAPVWTILHSPGVLIADPRHLLFAAYPILPWAGVAAVGYGLARVYGDLPGPKGPGLQQKGPGLRQRQRVLWRWGVVLTAVFIVFRAINLFGDPVRWTMQRSAAYTVVSFLNTNKYPPSLLFLLMTLGPALMALSWFGRGVPKILRAAVAFGRVPFFYFLAHLFVIHLVAVVMCYAKYGDAHWMFESPTLDRYPFTQPPGWGFTLPVVYLIWVGVVVSLYPLCRWFAEIKQRRSDPWLRFV